MDRSIWFCIFCIGRKLKFISFRNLSASIIQLPLSAWETSMETEIKWNKDSWQTQLFHLLGNQSEQGRWWVWNKEKQNTSNCRRQTELFPTGREHQSRPPGTGFPRAGNIVPNRLGNKSAVSCIQTGKVSITVEFHIAGISVTGKQLSNPLLLFRHQRLLPMQIAVVSAFSTEICSDGTTHSGTVPALYIIKDVRESVCNLYGFCLQKSWAWRLSQYRWCDSLTDFHVIGQVAPQLIANTLFLLHPSRKQKAQSAGIFWCFVSIMIIFVRCKDTSLPPYRQGSSM